MVRRDDGGNRFLEEGTNPVSGCEDPAGASPVSVSGNASSSRATTRTERDVDEAGRQKPVNQRELLSGERVRGPQHEVKSAASSQLQPEGRAAHFTAKATSMSRDNHLESDLGGVEDAARVQGSAWNTRAPSAQPSSRQGVSYKPKAKSSVVQRKSEEIEVPTRIATNNAIGGKGLWGTGRADRRGTHKGMDAKRPNSPRGRSPEDNVRSLQGQLRDVAKQQPGRKFHALYDRIHRSDVLQEAWNQVRRNQGAAGVDTQTIAAIEQQGVESFLEAIRAAARTSTGRRRSCADTFRRLMESSDRSGFRRSVIVSCRRLRSLFSSRSSRSDSRTARTGFDPSVRRRRHWRRSAWSQTADSTTCSMRISATSSATSITSRCCRWSLRKRFSGPEWVKRRKRVYFLQRWPSTKSMKRIRQRVKEMTPKRRSHVDPRDVIAEINPVLRGWGQYFRTGNAADHFNGIDGYVAWRLKRMRVHRKGRHLKPGEARRWKRSYFYTLGLHRLGGTVAYPEAA